MAGAQHDTITELDEIYELIGIFERSGEIGIALKIASRLNRVTGWLQEDISRMHQTVKTLETECIRDPSCRPAYALVAETAANILNAFNRAKVAIDSLENT